MPVRRHYAPQQDEATRQFAAALSEALHALRLRHRQVAAALGITLATVDSWTRLGKPAMPGEKNLHALCQWLDEVQPGVGARLLTLAQPHANVPPQRVQPVQPIPSVPESAAPSVHLRVPPTSFVGRTNDVREGVRIFTETPTRLLSLIGPGGIGKTRLALQTATALVTAFEGGIWWVELAPLREGALTSQAIWQAIWQAVWQTLASALNVRETAPHPDQTLAEQVVAQLHRASALLVFDNCEHVLAAAGGVVARLLRECPALKILATSREPLQLPEEQVWPLAALSLPPAEQRIDRARLNAFEAPRLFIERAFVQQHGFALSERQVPLVVDICRQLDGLPLAIELAAARLPQLSLSEIGRGLASRLSLLTHGSAFADPRHQTLRAVIRWSYDLLAPDERRLFAQLAVFTGGWTAEAARQVCGEAASVRALERLAAKSLIEVDRDAIAGHLRYRVLETIAEFAREMLAEPAAELDVPTLHARHATHYLSLAEQADASLSHLDGLEADLANLRAALRWSQMHDKPVYARLCAALWPFWQVRGHLTEGRAHVTQALEVSEDLPVPLRALLWQGAGALARQQADRAAAQQAYTQSLIHYRQLAQPLPLAQVLNEMGLILTAQHQFDQAQACYRESLALCDQFDAGAASARVAAGALLGLGLMAFRDRNYPLAQHQLQASLSAADQAGDPFAELRALNGLGEVARAEHQWAQARAFYARSVALCRMVNHKWALASALHNLGYIEMHLGNGAVAGAHFIESLTLFDALDEVLGVAECAIGLGAVCAAEGQVDMAAQFLVAGHYFLRHAKAPLTELEQIEFDRAAAVVRAKFPGLLDETTPLLFAPTVEQVLVLAERIPTVNPSN